MSETPLGVPGDDAPRDGEEPSRVVATTAEKLRSLADWLDAHPGANVSQIEMWSGSTIEVTDYSVHTADDLARKVKLVGGTWEKVTSEDSDLFRLRQMIAPGVRFSLVTLRDRVCERVVVGTREVEAPDPDAPKVTQVEEIVEWRCVPLLGREALPAAVVDPTDVPF